MFDIQIVPGHDNSVAIEIIVTHVQKMLKERSVKFRERMARAARLMHDVDDVQVAKPLTDKVTILPSTSQLKVHYKCHFFFKISHL